MLHIHNGDSSAETLKKSDLPGEHFAFREALIDGPTPIDVAGEEWRKLRAHHLADVYDLELVWTETEVFKQEQKLSSFPEHEEIILWFEHDLFCQTNLLYLLNWFATRNLGTTKLSLICIGEFPGLPNFRGLGELNVEQMASLFDGRHEVSAEENALATDAWQAYCSPDPTAIEKLLATDTSAMPFLKPALQLHLERFPFVRNGLGRIQNKGLEFIHGGLQKFVDLFPRFGIAEPVYGLGDAQFWIALRWMIDAPEPLLRVSNGEGANSKLSPEKIHESAFDITTIGESVLKGEADFVELNGVDQWLGGVHLVGQSNVWRWDEQNQRLRQV
jgi:hypothetical protein